MSGDDARLAASQVRHSLVACACTPLLTGVSEAQSCGEFSIHNTKCQVKYRGEVVMTVGATVPELNVEIWSGSHPFYTGKSSFVDTAGRVEKFQNKFKGDYFSKKKKSK